MTHAKRVAWIDTPAHDSRPDSCQLRSYLDFSTTISRSPWAVPFSRTMTCLKLRMAQLCTPRKPLLRMGALWKSLVHCSCWTCLLSDLSHFFSAATAACVISGPLQFLIFRVSKRHAGE